MEAKYTDKKEYVLLGRLLDIILATYSPEELLNYLAYVMTIIVARHGKNDVEVKLPLGASVTVVVNGEKPRLEDIQ